jgi:IS5 family transposase
LNDNGLQEDIFQIINYVLEKAGLMVKEWTIIDSTIVKAPSSTKNKEWKRDPEMHSTKKGNNYYFWMKVHWWADIKNWLIHSICVTPANVHDSKVYEEVLNWNEEITVWDSAYTWEKICNIANKRSINHLHSPKWRRLNKLTFRDIAYWKIVASMRAKWEFTWWVIKNLRWYRKTKYKWLAKNCSHWYLLCWLSNIYRMRYKLLSM